MVPSAELPPAVPSICQLTEVLLALRTVAVNCCWALVMTLGSAGEMLTVTAARAPAPPELPPHPDKAQASVNVARSTPNRNSRRQHSLTIVPSGRRSFDP